MSSPDGRAVGIQRTGGLPDVHLIAADQRAQDPTSSDGAVLPTEVIVA